MASKAEQEWYRDGCKNMFIEGIEVANKILAYMAANKDKLVNMDDDQKKKFMLEFEPCKQFNAVHPVVFQFIVLEGIFNDRPFKRYINAVFGKERTQNPDKLQMYKERAAQQALYYKYLLEHFNANIDKNVLHNQYEEMVKESHKEIDRMFDLYKSAEQESKIDSDALTDQKRHEILELLKQKIEQNKS